MGSEEPGYDAFTTKLQELLGLDDEKAKELRDTICGLAQSEMSGMNEEEESPASEKPEPGKKPGLALILGSK